MFFVAQAGLNQKPVWSAMLYLAGIVLAVGIGIAVIAAIRRWMRAGELENASNGLTLGQARLMRAKGLLTEQEFDQVKRVIIGSTTNGPGEGNAESAL